MQVVCSEVWGFFPALSPHDEHYEVSDSRFCGLCSAEQTFATEERALLEPSQTYGVQQMHSWLQ